MRATVARGGAGAMGAARVTDGAAASADGSSQCGRRPGLFGLLASSGNPPDFVSPHEPGQTTHAGDASPSTSSAGTICGPLPSAWSNQVPVQCEPLAK